MAARGACFASVKQVRVRTCAEQEEHELLTVHAIDQKPIGTDVTFTKADVITGEIVIAVLSGRGCCAASWSTMDSSRLRSQPRLAASLRSFLKRLERTTSSIGQYLVHSIVKGCVTGGNFRGVSSWRSIRSRQLRSPHWEFPARQGTAGPERGLPASERW